MKNFLIAYTLIFLLFVIMVGGLNHKSRQLVLQARDTRKEVSTTSEKIVALVETKDQLEALSDEQNILQEALPSSTQATALITRLISQEKLGASMKELKSGEHPTALNGALTLTIEGTVGSLSKLQHFMSTLENQKPVIQIKQLTLTGTTYSLQIGILVDETH